MVKVKRILGIALILALGLAMVPGSLALANGAPDIEWTDQFGTSSKDEAYGVYADSSGVYMVGSTRGALPGQTSAGYHDAYIRKYDADGTELWTRQFGTADDDYARGVYGDSGGVYVVGETWGDLGDTNAGNYDAYIRKYDASGTELWTRQFGTADNDYAYGVYADSGGVYMVGYTWGALPGYTNAGDEDAFIRKYDASGTEQWTRQFGTSVSDRAKEVYGDSSGVYMVGYTSGTLPGQTSVGGYDAFIRKYDADGGESWTRQFGTDDADYAEGVYADSSGVYVVGETLGAFPGYTNAGDYDVFIRNYDADGTESWTDQFGSTENDYAYGVSGDSSGVYMAGYTWGTLPGQTSVGNDDAFIRKYNASGDESWTRQFGTTSNDFANEVYADSSGVYVVGYTWGAFSGYTNAGDEDAFVVKFPPTTQPTMQTWAAKNVTDSSARLKGYLAGLGTAASVDCSFEWGETTAYGNSTTAQSMSATGVFKKTITGLSPNTTYHYRSVGVGDGTGYGPDKSFTTDGVPPTVQTWAAKNVTTSSARLKGYLADLGSASSVDCYFEWGETTSYGDTTSAQSMTATGVFKQDITGLTPGTEYHYRSVAVGWFGTSYGPDKTFTTTGGTPPTIETWKPNPVYKYSAKLRGKLDDMGSASSVNTYFEWGTTTSYGNTTSTSAMSSTGTFKRFLSGLTAGTTYHYRSVGDGDGTDYGPDKYFTTNGGTAPTVQTWNPQNVTYSSAKLRGYVASLGSATTVDVYFEWGETTAYGNTTSSQAMTATGVFKQTITGLTPGGKLYHYRLVAVGSGTAYGPDKTFTSGDVPG